MNVPEIVEVEVVSADVEDLSDLIVQIKIDPGYRNPYHILFPKTDRRGISEIRRDDFIGQFDDHLEVGLMDHAAGSLNQLKPLVELSLFDDSWWLENESLVLKWPLLTHERRVWSSRREHYDYVTSSTNRAFTCRPVGIDLHKPTAFRLDVSPKA